MCSPSDECGGLRWVEAFVTGPTVAREALELLGIPFEPLQLAEARDSPSEQLFDLGWDHQDINPLPGGPNPRFRRA